MTRQFLKHLINKGKKEVVLLSGFIQFPAIIAHPIPGIHSNIYELFLLIFHYSGPPPLLGDTLNWASPLTVRDRVDDIHI